MSKNKIIVIVHVRVRAWKQRAFQDRPLLKNDVRWPELRLG